MGAGSRALEGRNGRNQFGIDSDDINNARESRADVGVEVRAADTLVREFVKSEWYGDALPEGIVAHMISADQWPDVKARLDARRTPHKWRRLILNAPLNVANGADW